jgi:hypothetical protein
MERDLRDEPPLRTSRDHSRERGRFFEADDREAGFAQDPGVRGESAMVRDGVTGLLFGNLPRDSDRSLLAILADLPPHDVVERAVVGPHPFHDPRRPIVEVEARMGQGEDEPPARRKDPRDLFHGPCGVADVLERHVRHDAVKGRVRDPRQVTRLPLKEPRAGRLGPVASSGVLEGSTRGFHPDHRPRPLSRPSTG